MATYTVTLGSGASYQLEADSQAEAARLANEGAQESGDSIRLITAETGSPIEVGGSVFEANEQTPDVLTADPYADLALRDALELLPEAANIDNTFVPTLASQGDQTSQLFGMSRADVPSEELQTNLEGFEDTGMFALTDFYKNAFGLPQGSMYDSSSNNFVDAEGNILRAATGFDLELLKDVNVLPEAAFGGGSRGTGLIGSEGFLGGTQEFMGDASDLLSQSSAAREALGRPESLEGINTQAAFLRGLEQGGYGSIEGPRTGFQRYLESLRPAYESLYGLGNVADNLQVNNSELLGRVFGQDATGEIEAQEGLGQGATFEDFVARSTPNQIRQQSGNLFNILAQGSPNFSDPLNKAIDDPTNQVFNNSLQELALSALRGQVGSTGFNLIAGSLPSMNDLLTRDAARTEAGTAAAPRRLIDQLGQSYGIKKRKVGADGSVTEEFFGG